MQTTGKPIVDHGVLQDFLSGNIDVHGSSDNGYVTSVNKMSLKLQASWFK